MKREELVRELIEQQIKLNKFGDYLEYKDVTWFDECECDLAELILDLLDIPEDNTVDMEKKYGDKWIEQKDTVCRDGYLDIIYGAKDVDITYKHLIDLKNDQRRNIKLN